jgi:hypothetical protein
MTIQLHDYQLCVLEHLKGWKPGEMMLISTPRQTGKTYLNQLFGKMSNRQIFMMGPEPKYKFSRANWYQAEFDWRKYDEVEEWCEQQFGPHPQRPDAWSRWWHKFENSILFRDEKDYVLFMLRWS